MAHVDTTAELNPWTWIASLRTPTLPPATATNTLVIHGDRVVVIEPASPHPESQSLLVAKLEELQAQGKSLHAALLTHHHSDHIGYARALRERFSIPLMAHAETARRVPFAVDHTLAPGETLELGQGVVVECVFTPGHAPGHLVYVEHKGRLAHAGDMVAGEGSILIDPDDAGDMSLYLASLQRVGALDVDRLVPAHGPVLDGPALVADRFIQHRLDRERKVLGAIGATPRAPVELLAVAYADTPSVLWPLAAKSLEAHLRKLEQDGLIDRSGGTVSLRRSSG